MVPVCVDVESFAGVAQLVERNLAKVEVASSSLVSRSTHKKGSGASLFNLTVSSIPLAGWQSGYVAACKAVNPGSIPGLASRLKTLMIVIKVFFCLRIPHLPLLFPPHDHNL